MNKIEFLHNIDKYKGEDHSVFLQHYGILGQKWGQRRWQNPDGTFNEAGKERYFGTGKFQPVRKDEKIGAQKYNYRTGQYYDTKYQNPDGTLTKKGEKRLQKYINKPEGLFSNVNGKISIEAYNKATGNNVVDRKKEAEKAAYNKLLNDLKEKDKNITVKHELKGKEISQEEFDNAAKEIKDTFEYMDSWDDDYNEIADLGLYKMIKNNTLDNDCKPGDKWDRFWFMEEDQTDGYPEIVDLYRKGYSREYIKQFTDKLADMDYDEAENISTSLTWGSRNVDNILNDIMGPENQKIGSMKGSQINSKYQNPDGSLTEKGQELRNKNYDKFKKKINQDLYKEYRDEIDKKINENRENNEKIYNNNLKKLDECLNEYGFDDEGYKKVKTNTAGKIDFQNNLNRFIYYEAEHEISEVPDVNNKLRSVDKKDIQSRFDKGEKAIQNFDKSYSKALNEVARLYYDAYKSNIENPVTFNEFKNSINISKFKGTRNPVYLNYLGNDLNKSEGKIGYTTFINSNIPGGFKSGYLVFDQNGNINTTSSFDPEYRKVHVDNN